MLNRLQRSVTAQDTVKTAVSSKVTSGLLEIVSTILKDMSSSVTAEELLFTTDGKAIKTDLVEKLTKLIDKNIEQ